MRCWPSGAEVLVGLLPEMYSWLIHSHAPLPLPCHCGTAPGASFQPSPK
ncbi:hypothetical protein [Nannocystis pusilla]